MIKYGIILSVCVKWNYKENMLGKLLFISFNLLINFKYTSQEWLAFDRELIGSVDKPLVCVHSRHLPLLPVFMIQNMWGVYNKCIQNYRYLHQLKILTGTYKYSKN